MNLNAALTPSPTQWPEAYLMPPLVKQVCFVPSDGPLEQLLTYSDLPNFPRCPFLSVVPYWDSYNYLVIILLYPYQWVPRPLTRWRRKVISFFFFFFFFFDFLPYLGLLQLDSQARSPIGAIAAGLHHSHSNAESQLHLWPTPQLTATPDP